MGDKGLAKSMQGVLDVLERRRKGNWYYVEKIIGGIIGIALGIGVALGIDWLLWKAWNWVVPGIFHAGQIDNFWMFVVLMLLLSAIGGFFKGVSRKA